MLAWSKKQHFGKNNQGEWDGGHHAAYRLMNDGQSLSKNTVPLFLFFVSPSQSLSLYPSFSLLERQHEALAEHDSVSSIYSQVVSSSSWGTRYTILWRGRGYKLQLFICRGRQGSPIFSPIYFVHTILKRDWKRAGHRIKERSRPPEWQNMIQRCPMSVFHLILAGSPSGEIPQTHLQSSARGAEGKGMDIHTQRERRRDGRWISLWLILWVWESRAPNTGWPGFSNEFDSSLCLLSLTGDQGCIITSSTHTHTHARTNRSMGS